MSNLRPSSHSCVLSGEAFARHAEKSPIALDLFAYLVGRLAEDRPDLELDWFPQEFVRLQASNGDYFGVVRLRKNGITVEGGPGQLEQLGEMSPRPSSSGTWGTVKRLCSSRSDIDDDLIRAILSGVERG